MDIRDLTSIAALIIIAMICIYIFWQTNRQTGGPHFRVKAQTGGVSKAAVAVNVAGDDDGSFSNLKNASFDAVALEGGKTEKAFAANKLSETALNRLLNSASSSTEPVVQPYKMDAVPRGMCLIINNINFGEGMSHRYSSQGLTEQLETLFTKLQFKVMDYTNKTADQMMKIMKTYAAKAHDRFDAFICYVLTHGQKGKICGSDGKEVDLTDFINTFNSENCKSLDGKPKLFFIESCRTESSVITEDLKSELKELAEYLSPSDDEGRLSGATPPLQDFFIGYSTLLYAKSYRNNETGDVYTQEFISVMEDIGKREDLLTIMTEVNRRVSERGVYGTDGQLKQFPDMCTRLKKKLYFKPSLT